MGPVNPQITIMRIAIAKAQALPSIIDERFAKSRKASLTTQKKSRDFSCCLSFSLCVSITIILWSMTRKPEASPYTWRARNCGAAHPAACDRLSLTTEDQTEHETDSKRGKDCLRRVLADVLRTVVLKTAYAMERIVPHFFPSRQIFICHCACGRAEIFRRFARVRHATICFFFRLRRNRRALAHLVFVIHRIPQSSSVKLSGPMLR